MRKRVLRLFLVSMIIISLTMVDFVMLGQSIALAARQEVETNVANVEFNAYLKQGEEGVYEKEAQMAGEEILVLDFNVVAKGVLENAKVIIDNANFSILKDKVQNNSVKEIRTETNEIELNNIVYGNHVKIEIPITFRKQEKLEADYFQREIIVRLEGMYKNEIEQKVEAQRNLKINWTQEADVVFHQNISKYISLPEVGTLLEQDIATEVAGNVLPRETENLLVQVPVIEGKQPVDIYVLKNGVRVTEEEVEFTKETNVLEIKNEAITTWGDGKVFYQVMYLYEPEVAVVNRTIELNTLINTKLYTKNAMQKEEKKAFEIQPVGNVISLQKSATKELYKGYWYAKAQQETIFTEENVIQIANQQAINEIQIGEETEEFSNDVATFPLEGVVRYQNTKVKKEEFDRIFGAEGQLTITDGNDAVLAQIHANSPVNENGEIVVQYEAGVTNIKITTTKPVVEGNITISHTKAVAGEVPYSKEQLKTITNLKTTTKVNSNHGEVIAEANISLLDTKTEAKLEVNQSNLSTLQVNENVQFLVTLKSDEAQYNLFKNPSIQIILPAEIGIQVKNITQLNGEEELKITSSNLSKNEKGEKVITLTLEGEQLNFVNSIHGGIQISLTADITIDKTVPSKSSEITMMYTNENSKGEELTTKLPIQFNSKYGVLMVNKIGDEIESIDDKEKEILLPKQAEAKEMKQSITVLNNYENEINGITIRGKLSEKGQEGTTFDLQLKQLLTLEGKVGKIYYSEDNENWVETPEDFSKIRFFKAEIAENLQPQEAFTIFYPIGIPENLAEDQMSYSEINLTYTYLGNQVTTGSKIVFRTEEKQEEGDLKVEETEQLKIELVGRTGGKGLTEGQEVYEGQGIKYIVKITNQTQEVLKQIQIVATQENAIFYDGKVYHDGWNSITGEENIDYTRIEENPDLVEKKINIETIQPGETIEIPYQFSVKEVDDKNQVTKGKVKIAAEGFEAKELETLENPIKTGKLKLQMRSKLEEEYPILTNREYPFFLDITNLTEEAQQDVMLYVPVPEGFDFKTESLFEADNYEFIEYKNREVTFRIPTIEAGQKISIRLGFEIKSMDVNIEQKEYHLSYRGEIGKETYVSNEMDRIIYNAETDIQAKQYGSINDEWVENGDKLTYTCEIENKGTRETNIDIIDYIPMGANVQKAMIQKYDISGDIPVLLEEKELDREVEIQPEEGEEAQKVELRNVIYNADLAPKEKIIMTIDTIINTEEIFTKEITNRVQISAVLQEISCNEVTYKVKGNENIEDPESNYDIRGVAWVDENKNGLKEENEKRLENIPVFLMEEETGEIVVDDYGNTMEMKTNEKGEYEFTDLKQGNYFVVFQYDATQYKVAEYQKTGVSQDSNSDVISRDISLQGKEQQVAITGTLELSSGNLNHIDAGFVEGEIFDFKLDKYINKIIVQNKQGTTVKQYDNTQLAKVELDSKQMNGTSIIIEYKIQVTNEGELAGYINEIVDYQPKDLNFNSEMNKNWYQTTTGELASQELSNQLIKPGETKSVILTLMKEVNQNNIGTIINTAEIKQASNDYYIQDRDSTPGNKIAEEDDMSTAEIIVSIRTGSIMLYLTLIFTIIGVIGIGSYMIKKKVLTEEKEEGSNEK